MAELKKLELYFPAGRQYAAILLGVTFTVLDAVCALLAAGEQVQAFELLSSKTDCRVFYPDTSRAETDFILGIETDDTFWYLYEDRFIES